MNESEEAASRWKERVSRWKGRFSEWKGRMAWPNPDTFGGKLLLSLWDKACLGIAVGFAAFVLKEVWELSQVETSLLRDVPSQINSLSAEYLEIVNRVHEESGDGLRMNIRRAAVIAEEVETLFLYSASLTGETCMPDYVASLRENVESLKDLGATEASELERTLRSQFPDAIDCIRQHMLASLS